MANREKTFFHFMSSIFVYVIFGLFFSGSINIEANEKGYFITFFDKQGTPHTLGEPTTYLSGRAIQRRFSQNISIDSTDLPVSPLYIARLELLGLEPVHTSRWMNGAIVFTDDQLLMDTLNRHGFVKFVEHVYTFKTVPQTVKSFDVSEPEEINEHILKSVAEYTRKQIEMLNGAFLHDLGFQGEGMHIALMDAGYFKADETFALMHLFDEGRVLGVMDFVNDDMPFYGTHSHGLNVLSVMAGKVEGEFSGTATKASYWLFRTEDVSSEYPIEADYWVCAAELADSAGVDIIQTSLGYSYFDDATMNYTYAMTDGSTRISRAASLASQKGMVVVISAGNERQRSWRYISMPADADEVLAVGAVTADSIVASFSSMGFSVDGRVKPDVMAQGVATTLISNNVIATGNGTSFAAPLISGMVACLWQSMPDRTSAEIVQLIRQSGHLSSTTNPDYGYGIPDFKKAYLLGNNMQEQDTVNYWNVSPNPFISGFSLYNTSYQGLITIKIMNLAGQVLFMKEYSMDKNLLVTPDISFSPGIYILKLSGENLSVSLKLLRK